MKQLPFILFAAMALLFFGCQENHTISPAFPTNPDAYYGDWVCTQIERDTTMNGSWLTKMSSPNGIPSYNLRINATVFESDSGLTIQGGGTFSHPVYWDQIPSYSFDSHRPAFVKTNLLSLADSLGNFVSLNQTRRFDVVQFDEFATPQWSTMKLIFTYTLTDTNGVITPPRYQERFSYERAM